jgi:hypothetical protein
MQPQIDAAYRALLQPHFSAYAADEIDAAELDRRKQRAHDEAASQHQPALSLNRAHSTYESASRAAAAAYEAYEAAAAAAAAAKLSLESELRAIEGPLGVKAKDLVLKFFQSKGAASNAGSTVLEAAQALASNGVQEAQVRSIVQGLVDDGHLYSTIVDDHFIST